MKRWPPLPARVLRVVDGDTVVLDIDLGWRVWRHDEHVRVAGLWCPELREPGGRKAKEYASWLLPIGLDVFVVSHQVYSLQRSVGEIVLSDGRDFATLMIAAGHGQSARPA